MAEVQILPLADYASGTYNFGPVDIGDAVTIVDFKVQRATTATPDIWPNASTRLLFQLEMSINNGPWSPHWSIEAGGGITTDKFGNEAAFLIGGGTLPSGQNRRARGSITVTNGPLRTSASVIVL